MRIPNRALVASLSLAIVAAIYLSTRLVESHSESSSGAIGFSGTNPPKNSGLDGSVSRDADEQVWTNLETETLDLSGYRVRMQFDALIAGNEQIHDFIQRHLVAAGNGDADSAYFVAEAMMYCVLDMSSLSQTIDHFSIEEGNSATLVAQIESRLVGMPAFYAAEAKRHIERGLSCRKLDLDVDELQSQASAWQATAREMGNPTAIARSAAVDLETATPIRITEAKTDIRAALEKSREFMVLRYASSVVAAATGKDAKIEHVAWQLLACAYRPCDTLNYYNRGLCDMASMNGASYCTQDMTDLDFLFHRYPGEYDIARARADEIKTALDAGDWQAIGLE